MVARSQAQRAADILNQLRKEARAAVACPKCGSHNIEEVSTPRKTSNWLTALLTFGLGDHPVAPYKVSYSFACGC